MSRVRKTDWAAFVAGLLFVVLGGMFVVSGTSEWGVTATWLLPVLAVGLGIVAITRALTRSRGRDHDPQT